MPPALAAPAGRPQFAQPPPAPSAAPHARRADGREAVNVILGQPAAGEGFRHLWIGRSRSGKSYASRYLLELASRDAFIVSHDVKDRVANLEGQEFPGPEEFHQARRTQGGLTSNRLIFRRCDAEPVAELARALAEVGLPVVLNLDEVSRAATPGGQGWSSPSALWVLTQGGAVGASFTGNAQSGKRVPDEALNEAHTIGVFRQRARAANYLADILDLEAEVANLVRNLGRHEFILLVDGEWHERKIYKFGR